MTQLSLEQIGMVAEFYQVYCEDQINDLLARSYDVPVLEVSLADLASYDPDLYDDLIAHPDRVVEWFETVANDYEAAVEDVFYADDVDASVDLVSHEMPEHVEIAFTDPPKMAYQPIGEPRSDEFGELVAFEGVCQQVSDPKPRLLSATLECARCGSRSEVDLSDTFELDNAVPDQCPSCERRAPFQRVETEAEEYQQLRVQEPPEDAINASNPREVVCDAQGEYHIDRVEPGNRVTVVGILREDSDGDSTLRDDRLEIWGVVPEEQQFEDVEFDEQDIEKIEELSESEHLTTYLQNSIAPDIVGYDTECLAVALQLFGGVSTMRYGNRRRGEIHNILIGEPGTGKSKILESARNIAPRAISASGTGSTEVGLTATAVKEQIGNEEQWTLQAGSLVLADGGLITIDEFDNMREEQQSALDSALSDGRVEVDKANVHATLNARCSALLAANPEDGRFNLRDPFKDQFDMPEEVLNRCDLVFTFVDEPNQETDAAVASAVLDLHTETERATADGGSVVAVDDNGVINHDLLRKYIAYARREYEPMLTEDAKEKLMDFYQTIRDRFSGDGDDRQIPLNARRLEGLRRYTQAVARARLEPEARTEHAEAAIELVMASLNQTVRDPDGGGYDIDRLEQGKASVTQQERKELVKDTISELEQEYDNGAPVAKVIGHLTDEMSDEKAKHEIESLKEQGEVYEPETDRLRTT